MPKLTYVYQDPESFNSGETPYGTYDSDSTFQTDIVSVSKKIRISSITIRNTKWFYICLF